MKFIATFVLSLSILVLWILGCASAPKITYWDKPGGTPEELSKARYVCLQESQQDTSHSVSNEYGGESVSRPVTNHVLFDACMNAQGWTLVETRGAPRKARKVKKSMTPPIETNNDQSEAQSQDNNIEQTDAKQQENKIEEAEDKTSMEQVHSMLVNKNKVKLRKSPSNKSAVIKTLKKGEEVNIIKQKDAWYLVELKGGEAGWCYKSSLNEKN